jgi:hypothetical protein
LGGGTCCLGGIICEDGLEIARVQPFHPGDYCCQICTSSFGKFFWGLVYEPFFWAVALTIIFYILLSFVLSRRKKKVDVDLKSEVGKGEVRLRRGKAS